MLQIKGITDCLPVAVELDPYVAININFGSWDPSLEPTAYWRAGDLEKQFIEIGVAENKGIIRSITLVLIKKIILEDKIFPEIQLKLGIPVFEKLDYDKNRLFDEVGHLEMFVGKDKLQVFFSHNKITSGLVCDRVICLFDKDNNFCGFEVSDITEKEMNILKENFINRLHAN
ncbi:hypothetical protein E3J79_00590 [Candidatus Dependentiae bacterium]|nr:MAG: hypothetical protein E3J79_00590 [Candidatus Dependentiae bacterium]